MRGKLYSIPLGLPFLPTLMRAVLSGELPGDGSPPPDPLDLSAITILLPTRRAERELAEACLTLTGRQAMLLPRLRAIGSPDEDRLAIAGGAGALGLGSGTSDALDLPPAIEPTRRLLLLTRLVMQWSDAMRAGDERTSRAGIGEAASAGASTPGQAAAMAGELASLMDTVEREGCSLDGLEKIVPDDFSDHWQKSLSFLRILTEHWPAVLVEKGELSPYERQNRLMRAEADRLRRVPPEGPVIVAGVTGSIPASVELMRAVADLPWGAIVLPGLDMELEDGGFAAILPDAVDHPDFGLARLVGALGAERSDIRALTAGEDRAAAASRRRFLSEAMRPTSTTDRWHRWVAEADREAVADGLRDVSLIEAATPQEEAEVVALILREAAETPDRTAALVTPDRLLARRVAIRLEGFGIIVDDSAGRPFAKTVPGAYLELVIDAIARDFAPVATMALLKHPLTRFGLSQREVRFAARALEMRAFRRPYIGKGLDGIDAALQRAEAAFEEERASAARAARTPSAPDESAEPRADELWREDHARAVDLVGRMRAAFAPMADAVAASGRDREREPLPELAARHFAAAQEASRLTAEEIEADHEPELTKGEAGSVAARFFGDLIAAGEDAPVVEPRDYPDLYRSLIATLPPVIASVPKHPRISIWGPMEAQLLTADTVILGSLNETTWPSTTDPGPWLNRPMRKDLGLPSPEEDIGREARGFASLMGGREVILTRPKKSDGVPTVPSRWLMRMRALLNGLKLDDVLEPRKPWLVWARERDRPTCDRAPRTAPAPCPPVAARPRRLSVSRVERWIANPYAIFAGEILRLTPLERLGAEPGAALHGQILHEAMSRFAERHPIELPEDVARQLAAIAGAAFDEYAADPRIGAFWKPRFERFATWFAETEPARRANLEETVSEVPGVLEFEAKAGPFKLTARADRLDVTAAGLVITDYKTGQPPSDTEVRANRSPQLPLEAAIALAGGFRDLDRMEVKGLRYIRASGGEPPGEERLVDLKGDIADHADGALEALKQLVEEFDDPTTPYRAVRRPGYGYDYDDYAHLARVAEWALAEGEGAETGGNGNGSDNGNGGAG